MGSLKNFLVSTVNCIGLDRISFFLRNHFLKGKYVYAINYHETREIHSHNFEKQLILYRKFFSNVTENDLEKLISKGSWEKEKPGLIISFDDGLRSNFDNAIPLLEKYGFTAWIFVPTDFINSPVQQQMKFAGENAINCKERYDDDRIAMTWDEIRILCDNHVIGSHTKSHYRLIEKSAKSRLRSEILDSKKVLERKIGHCVSSFCWVGGNESAYSSSAAKIVKTAGYQFSFMTNCQAITAKTDRFQLQRTNIESHWPIGLVRFYISGLMDLVYSSKRARVNKLTSQ